MVGSAWETCFRRKILELGIEEQDVFYRLQIKQLWGAEGAQRGGVRW